MLSKVIHLKYYAALREQRGCGEETVHTLAKTTESLYEELKKKHNLSLDTSILKVAVNNEFVDWLTPLSPNDMVVFIPPVNGG
ncbi:MAG: MoaD/ThiS family protein [Candidatus Omnitrophica bacterium]|nr:MoaD/ThiS family protein [Candidatus Omnitrophota bacterium]